MEQTPRVADQTIERHGYAIGLFPLRCVIEVIKPQPFRMQPVIACGFVPKNTVPLGSVQAASGKGSPQCLAHRHGKPGVDRSFVDIPELRDCNRNLARQMIAQLIQY